MEQPNANKFLEEIKYFSSGNLSETVINVTKLLEKLKLLSISIG